MTSVYWMMTVTIVAILVTVHVVFFWKEVVNVSVNQSPWWPSWISDWVEKEQYFLRTIKGTFVASLVIVHAVVLEKKLKMSRPIRVHGDHLGFPIATKSNNTSSGPIEEHLWQVWWSSMQWFFRRSRKCLSQSESMVAILDFRSQWKVKTLLQDH